MKRVISRAPCLIRTSSGQFRLRVFGWQTMRMNSHDHDHDHGETTETVTINWKNRDGTTTATKAKVGSNLLSVARKYEIELEGACEGVCACSTCHIILEDEVFDSQPEPTDDEEDMLDQAFGLTSTSRLGCQFCVGKQHEGILVKLPLATRNFYVDGHTPKPH